MCLMLFCPVFFTFLPVLKLIILTGIHNLLTQQAISVFENSFIERLGYEGKYMLTIALY